MGKPELYRSKAREAAAFARMTMDLIQRAQFEAERAAWEAKALEAELVERDGKVRGLTHHDRRRRGVCAGA